MEEKAGTEGDPCLSILRGTDRDRYLACLLSPREKRGALAALYAFNAEIARIRDVVREPLAGEIRLRWWRDMLEGSKAGDAGGNPVAAGLLDAVETYDLPRQPLIAMTEARIFDLYDDPMPDRHALEAYAGETASVLIQLAGLILSPPDAPAMAEAAGHAGIAQMVAGSLLLLPIHRHRQQLYVPLDILAATGLDRDSFLAGDDEPAIAAAIDAFATLGLEHLAQARAAGPLPPSLFAAFLPVALAEPVLSQARKAGAALFETDFRPPQWRRQWTLLRAAMRRRF